MQKARTWKRVSAMVLTIAMLVGMLSVLGGLTTSAATTEQMKFKADFSDLAKIAEDGGAFADTTYIRPGYATETDKAIKAWVDARFDMVSGYANNFNRALLGQSSTSLSISKDTWSGENYWSLMQSGYIQHGTKNSGQVYRLVESFVPKFDGKQAVLANFEAKLTFSVAAPQSQPHGILVAFHEKTAAFTRCDGDYVFKKGAGSMVLLNNGAGSYAKASGFGMAIYDQNNTLGTDGATLHAPLSAIVNNGQGNTDAQKLANSNIDGELFANTLASNTKYDLIVRVVGTKVTATVKDMDGNVVHTKEKTLNQAGEGYISFGSSNAANRFFAIEIQELDENGKAVDFGTKTGKEALETLKVDFADVPEIQYTGGKYYHNTRYDTADTAVGHDMNTDFLTAESTTHVINTKETILADYLESKLAFYYSQEGGTFERFNVNGYLVNKEGVEWTGKGDTSSNVLHPDTGVAGSGWVDGVGPSGNTGNGIAKWYLDSNKYLAYTNNNKNGDSMFRKSGSIALKDKNGDLLQIDNFKLEFDFKMYADGTWDYSNIAVGFHANQPYIERARKTQAMFAISPYGGYFLGDNYDLTTGKIFNKSTGGYDDFSTETAINFANQSTKHATTNERAAIYPFVSETKVGHNALAHLTLTVVGNTATAKVTKGEEVILEKTVSLGTYYGAGYLFLSGSNQQGWYSNIEVTRLDVNGNPVDFSDDNEGFTFGESFDAKATYYYKDSKFWRNTGADMFWMQGGTASYYKFNEPATYADDAATVAHLKEKFDFWAYREGSEAKLSEPYQSTEDVLAADTYLKAASYLHYTTEGLAMYPEKVGGGEALRKGFTIMPKIDGKTIKARNVEISTDVIMTYDQFNFSMWNIDLRSKNEGEFITSASNNKYATHVGIQVRPDGINIVDGTAFPTKTADIAAAAGFSKWNDGATHYNVRVYAKVVNNKLTVKVTDSKTGATVYEVTDKVISYVEEGYVALSTAQAWSLISNLYVNVLNGKGDAVADPADAAGAADGYIGAFHVEYNDMFPFGQTKQAALGIPAYLQRSNNVNGYDYFNFTAAGDHFVNKNREYKVADGYSLVTDGDVTSVKDADGNVVVSTKDYTVDAIAYKDAEQTIIKVASNSAEMDAIVKGFINDALANLNARFDAYYVDTQSYKGASLMDNGWGTELSAIYLNRWLQFGGLAATVDKTQDPVDNHISMIVPKNYLNGEYIKADEFSASWDLRLNDAGNYGTAYFVFNMPEAGNIGGAAVSNAAIDFNSDLNAIKINKSQFQFWNGTEWVDLIADGAFTGANNIATINLKVVDGKLTGTVKFDGKTAQAFEVELTNTDAGYFALGHNGVGVNFGQVTIDTGAPTAKIATVEKTEGGKINVERVVSDKVGFYKYVVTATADAGWQLKANTLLGTDANGETVYPTGRVGFRSDMNGGDTFYFYSAEDITFGADFYTAHNVSEANMTILGTSYNNEKVGVRFVGRMYMTEKDGVKYTEIDGKLYKVVDYGMLFAVQAGLDWGEENGLGSELVYGSDNPYIKKASAVEHQKHYDIAANYVDVSATVTGLGGREETEILSRGYLVVEMAEGVTAVAYTEKEGISFCDASGKNTVTYLNAESGNDANAGTAGAPVKTLAAAIAKTVPNGEVVNQGTVTLSGALGTGNAKNGVTLSGGTYKLARHTNLNSPVTFADTTLVVTDTELPEVIYANGHKFVVKEDVTMEGALTGLYGGCYQGAALDKTELEIYAGNYYSIYGGSSKAYVAESHITVGGTTNAGMKTTGEANHNVCIWGGGNESADTGDTYITFGGEAYAYMIYGGSGQGGTISGDTHVTINGGEVAQVFGGCDRVSMTGDTNVTINAGTVTRRIYGGCYNETNLISWDSEHHVTGNTTVTLYEAANITNTGDYECGIWATSRYKSQFADENSTLIYENAAAKAKFASKLGTAFCDPCKTEKVGI